MRKMAVGAFESEVSYLVSQLVVSWDNYRKGQLLPWPTFGDSGNALSACFLFLFVDIFFFYIYSCETDSVLSSTTESTC